ncbi:YciI family protein [Phenylobacterium sp.]|uniref:YciI family protein n=1 Tax=Phenylobacterium sp. TaxID=1871053 RepID=UPI002DF02881|nr:YciI family protein [Phenylobacterium sp.]
MPLFVLTCLDKPGALPVRMAAREDHLAWVKDQPLKLGGPFLDEAGDMAGSLMIVEVEDLAAAKAFNAADPYTQAGLWASVEIRPFRITLAKL